MVDIYNIALLVEKGFEETNIKEFKKIINKEINFEIFKFRNFSLIILKNLDLEDSIKISYISRVIHDSLILLSFCDYKDFYDSLSNIDIPFKFSKMKIKIIKDKNKHNINLSKNIYEKIKKFSEKGHDKIVFKGYITKNKIIFGIAFSDMIGKRNYKIINFNNSINPVSISSFLNYINVDDKSKILVVYSKDGTIPIEIGILSKNIPANFWSKKSFYIPKDLSYLIRLDEESIKDSNIKIYAVDDFSKNILISKRNSLNAMVKDLIFFKKININYLDIQIDQKFDLIIIDLYKQGDFNIKNLLYTTRNLLEDHGKIVVVCDKEIFEKLNDNSKKFNLKIVDYKSSIFYKEIKRFYILTKNNF